MVDKDPPARIRGAPKPPGLERVAGPSRLALAGAAVATLAFAVFCVSFGWSEDVAAWGRYAVIGVAVAALALYVAFIWLGSSETNRRGSRPGGARRLDESAASEFRGCFSAPVHEPFVGLQVLLPLICAAATFYSVDGHASSRAFIAAAETTLLAELTGLAAPNAYLRARGVRTIDSVTAAVAVIVLVGGVAVSLSGLAGPGIRHGVQLVSSAMIFGSSRSS